MLSGAWTISNIQDRRFRLNSSSALRKYYPQTSDFLGGRTTALN